MKKLLTEKEMFENAITDEHGLIDSNTVRGEKYQTTVKGLMEYDAETVIMGIKMALGQLGLKDYIDIEISDKDLFMCCRIEDKPDVSQKSLENFMEFANKHNKRLRAIELINELNELTKEAGTLGLRLQ